LSYRAPSMVTARECDMLLSVPKLCDEPIWAVDRNYGKHLLKK
jgi:hypothetical protein